MDRLEIKSERLRVVFQSPGTFYKGPRFDWTGFITDVVLDGKHTFCTDESLVAGQGTGGRGLCNEFGIHEPVGYDEAKTGEWFPKIGIGLLKKTADKPYSFWDPCEITPFEVRVSSGSDTAKFVSEPVLCNGYAVRLTKTFSVEGNRLIIKYHLENMGEKVIDTTEYVHNFVSIDGKGIGKHSELSFSFVPAGENMPDIFMVNGNTIGFRDIPGKEFYWRTDNPGAQPPSWWMLKDRDTGAGIKETVDFPLLRVAIWGKAHVISPEFFIHIYLKPKETKEWSRVYEFIG